MLGLALLGCGEPPAPPPLSPEAAVPSPVGSAFHPIALPGALPDGVRMDFLGVEPGSGRVWVPAGNTGSVDVIGPGDQVTRIDGFPTAVIERRGVKRTVGPSSVAFGDGVAWVGNRGDRSVCAVDEATLVKQGCATLDASPDAVAYVAATHELWVTTPADDTIVLLDVTAPAAPVVKGKVVTEGAPECDAVDDARGRYYTNLEDKDLTVALDVHDHAVLATWHPACGEDGPKGLALAGDVLLVACPDHVAALDAGGDGKVLSTIETGAGVDAIDYLAAKRELYVGAAKAGQLAVVAVGAGGALTLARTVPTEVGARNAVATPKGDVYLSDSAGGRILVVAAGS